MNSSHNDIQWQKFLYRDDACQVHLWFFLSSRRGGVGGGGGCVFVGKIQIRISESKNGFCVFWGQIQKRLMNPLNPDSGRILRIKSKSGFSRFTIWASFWDRIWKKYFWQAVLPKKKWYATEAVHVWHCNWTYVGGALFLNPLTCHFFCTYVVPAYAGLFSK